MNINYKTGLNEPKLQSLENKVFEFKFSLSLSLSPENSGLHLSYFAEFVCCKILDSNCLFFLRCI